MLQTDLSFLELAGRFLVPLGAVLLFQGEQENCLGKRWQAGEWGVDGLGGGSRGDEWRPMGPS